MGALLDSHALYWLVSSPEELNESVLLVIADSQYAGALYVSPITAWELSLASQKPRNRNPPQLGTGTPAQWFNAAVNATEAKIASIHHRIAVEAARVVSETGHKDPADCLLIATARIKRLRLITRDRVILSLAAERRYLDVIAC